MSFRHLAVAALFVCVGAFLTGCSKSEVTEADRAKAAKEWSKDSYEDNMRKAGKGAELDDAKKREDAYKAAGNPGGAPPSKIPNDPNGNP